MRTQIQKLLRKYQSFSLPVKAAFWYTICNVLNKGVSLLATPIFTRILTEEQYGTYAIFRSWNSILIIITSLNVFLGGYKKGLLLFKNDVDRFTSSQLGLTVTLTLLTSVIYLFSATFWNNLFELPTILMVAMFFELLMIPPLDLWMSKQQFYYHYKSTVVVSLCMNFLCVIVAVVAVLLSNDKLIARTYGDVVVKTIFSGSLFMMIFAKGKTFYDKEYWLYALKFNLPLLPHYLSNYVLGQSDRLMIGKMVGTKEAAFYSVAYTISTMMLLITNAINSASTPFIYKTIDSGNAKAIRAKYNPVIILVALLSILTMAFAPEVIYAFAGTKYLDAIYVIPPIACSVYFIFIYSMYSTIEYFYQKTGRIAFATSLSALLNLLLNYVGIKIFGYYAAGYTTLICYIFLAIFHYIFYKKIIREKLTEIDEVYDLHLIVIVGLITIVFMELMLLTYRIIFIRYGIILVIATLLIVKRKWFIEIVKNLKKE